MKKLTLFLLVAMTITAVACSKKDSGSPESPRTDVPAALRGNWMYGNFSMTEYWNQSPDDYIGNGLEYAFAFTFNADGTYTQYFTAGSVIAGVQTYQQSVTKGTMVVNAATNSFKTYPIQSHYRRTTGGNVVEDRDLSKNELNGITEYTYTTGIEQNGTAALYLTLEGTDSPLTFLRK